MKISLSILVLLGNLIPLGLCAADGVCVNGELDLANAQVHGLAQSLDQIQETLLKTDPVVCEVVPTFDGHTYAVQFQKKYTETKGLSVLWAQEYTGADLLREQLERLPVHYPDNLLANIDIGEEYHSTGTTNLMEGKSPTGLLPGLNLKPYSKGLYGSDTAYMDIAKKFGQSGAYPMYIGNPMTWGGDEVPILGPMNAAGIYRAFDILSKGKSLIVTSAGNKGNDKLAEPLKIKASQELNLIVVGSATPDGFADSDSQKSPRQAIMAPSYQELSSTDKNGHLQPFASTSGAEPQCTAALAAFTVICGYSLSRDDALQLLAMTATKSPISFENPQLDGPGILNTYKIGQVAFRLKKQCGKEANFGRCIQESLQNPKTYDFTIDKDIGKAEALFPPCFGRTSKNTAPLCEQLAAFKKIRAQALLTGDPSLYQGISCIYDTLGFHENAKYFKTVSFFSNPANTPNRTTLLINMLKDRNLLGDNATAAVLATNPISSKDISVLLDLLKDPDPITRSRVINIFMSEPINGRIVSALFDMGKDSDPGVRANRLSALGKLLPEAGKPRSDGCSTDGYQKTARGGRIPCDDEYIDDRVISDVFDPLTRNLETIEFWRFTVTYM